MSSTCHIQLWRVIVTILATGYNNRFCKLLAASIKSCLPTRLSDAHRGGCTGLWPATVKDPASLAPKIRPCCPMTLLRFDASAWINPVDNFTAINNKCAIDHDKFDAHRALRRFRVGCSIDDLGRVKDSDIRIRTNLKPALVFHRWCKSF
jgi:hypothetical protein